MGCPVPVHCRHCGEALDVYEPVETRFCGEECMNAATRDGLADRLEQLGKFELYRGSSKGPRSQQVWLTEAERDEIVAALRGEPETHLRCCGSVEPQYNCPETVPSAA